MMSTARLARTTHSVPNRTKLVRQPQLKETLSRRYPLFDQGPGYLIYNLRKPLAP